LIRFYWDTSALAKRYVNELGSPLVNRLFGRAVPSRMMVLGVTIGELVSIVVRLRNSGTISQAQFTLVMQEVRREVIAAPEISLEPAPTELVFASLVQIERHSINSTDALVLRSALGLAGQLRAAGDDLVLLASDQRLLRAAAAEGLTTFNPETDTLDRLDALIDAGTPQAGP
jgi:predicted nucleic acid-binding protein